MPGEDQIGVLSDTAASVVELQDASPRTFTPAPTPTYPQKVWLREAVELVAAAPQPAVTWTTLNVSEYVPTNAIEVILNAQAECDISLGGRPEFNVRRDDESPTIWVIQNRANAAQYANAQGAPPFHCPVNGATFEYEITDIGFTFDFKLQLLGYVV